MGRRTGRMKRQNDPLIPVHHSIACGTWLRTPQCMDRMSLDHETREALTRVALAIFTDMTNANLPFQNALTSIYLSGLQHGHEMAKGDQE